MHPLVKLGEIRNGTADARTHQLRSHAHPDHGRSVGIGGRIAKAAWCCAARPPRVRMQPHDLAFLLAGLLDRADAPASDHTHHPGGTGQWSPPPMHPQVTMPPALMSLRPDVAPYLPRQRRRRATRATARAEDASRWRVAGPHGRAGPASPVRPHRDDAGVQPAVSRPVDPGGRGIDHHRAFCESDRVSHRRALARRAPGQPLRRRAARDAGSGSTRRASSNTASTSATPESTGITRTIARMCSRTWASTEICSCDRASPTSSRRRTAKRS